MEIYDKLMTKDGRRSAWLHRDQSVASLSLQKRWALAWTDQPDVIVMLAGPKKTATMSWSPECAPIAEPEKYTVMEDTEIRPDRILRHAGRSDQ
jgi:hypothetical protein